MILRFNPDVFNSQDENTQKGVLDLLILFLEDRFIINISGLINVFYNEVGEYIFENSHLSKYMFPNQAHSLKNKIEALIKSGSHVSRLIKFYLSEIKVGEQLNETHPQQIVKIIRERSIIVIENYPNDWKFITGIINKYKSFGKRKEIYTLISNAVNNQYLTYNHAGGSGIKAQLEGFVTGIYSDFYPYKLMVIFDSDKEDQNYFKKEYKNLIEYIKGRAIILPPNSSDLLYEPNDLIVWHILYKRALENYVPLSVIRKELHNLTEQQNTNLNDLASDVNKIDFVVYHKPQYHYINIGKDKAKEIFPEMFLTNFDVSELEQRCAHHKVYINLPNGTKECVSEMEQILLKIAKII